MFTKALRALSSSSSSRDRDRDRFPEDPYTDRPASRRRATGPDLAPHQFQDPVYEDIYGSDDDSDEYGFPQARKNSVSNPEKHKRTVSREHASVDYKCPGCGEVYTFKESDSWQTCKYCHVKPYDARKRQTGRLPLGQSQARYANSPRHLEESFRNLYRRLGVLLLEASGGQRPADSVGLWLRPDDENLTSRATRESTLLPPTKLEAGGPSGRPATHRSDQSDSSNGHQTRTPPSREPPPPPTQSLLQTPAPHLRRFNSARAPPPQQRHPVQHQHTPTPGSRGLHRSPQSLPVARDRSFPQILNASPQKPLVRVNGVLVETVNVDISVQATQARRPRDQQQLLEQFHAELRGVFGNVDLMNTNLCTTVRPKPNTRSLSEGSNRQLGLNNGGAVRQPDEDKFDSSKPLPPIPRSLQPVAPIGSMIPDGKALLAGHIHDIVSSIVDSGEVRSIEPETGVARRSTYSTSPHIYWPELQAMHQVLVRYTLDVDYCARLALGNESDTPMSTDLRSETMLFTANVLACWLSVMYEALTAPREDPASPQSARYLFLCLASPLLIRSMEPLMSEYRSRRAPERLLNISRLDAEARLVLSDPSQLRRGDTSIRDRVLALLLGRIANLPDPIQQAFAKWFSIMPADIFVGIVKAIHEFAAIQIRNIPVQNQDRREQAKRDHERRFLEMLGASQVEHPDTASENLPWYSKRKSAWKLRSSCQALQLLVVANNIRIDLATRNSHASDKQRPVYQPFPVDFFYTPLLDPEAGRFDVAQDFDLWDSRRAKFTLCQYPFLLTLGTKVKILEYDNNRRKKEAVRAEWHGSRGMSADPYFHLPVRRDHIIDDSFKLIREARGSFSGQMSKKLKVHFEGEEGVDAGGPQKEWFLVLTQELFNPDLGLFYICDSGHFWFHSACGKSNEFYELVGAVFGLAIYNQTPLFAPFPPFLFKKLAAAAPKMTGSGSPWRHLWRPSLQDYAELYPDFAKVLRDGLANPQTMEGLTFEIPIWQNGQSVFQSLGVDGTNREIDASNIEEFVEKAINWVLKDSVKNQFSAFARGFHSICGGNALSLFRGEELELLVRGSEDFDLDTLRAAVNYANWAHPEDEEVKLESEDAVKKFFPVVQYFWDFFEKADIEERRRILQFITGTDRLPPAGIVNLVIKVSRLQMKKGEFRYPSARTCFNQILLPDCFTEQSVFAKVFRNALDMAGTGFGMK